MTNAVSTATCRPWPPRVPQAMDAAEGRPQGGAPTDNGKGPAGGGAAADVDDKGKGPAFPRPCDADGDDKGKGPAGPRPSGKGKGAAAVSVGGWTYAGGPFARGLEAEMVGRVIMQLRGRAPKYAV